MHFSPTKIDDLERAIVEETRVQLSRRGTEYVVLPLELRSEGGREILVGNTSTGDDLEFALDELEYLEILR
jgi:predicted DNA-binding transcriptional regulator YafY